MTGLDEGRLRAYLDGELEPVDRADVEAWLEESPEAAEAVETARRRRETVADAFARLETPALDLPAARAALERRVWRHREGARAAGRWPRARWAQAAGLVLLLGAAGASAAVPGSPVRAWLRSVLGDGAATPAADPALTTEAAAGERGLRVRPAEGGRLEISLSPEARSRLVVVRLVDDERGGVYAARASFSSGDGRIEAALDAGEAGPVRVEIPRSAASVTLRVDGRVWLEKRGERLAFPGPTARVSGDTIRFGDPR